MARADTFHERDTIQMAREKTTSGHRYGYAAEQNTDERRQHEKSLGAHDRAAYLGPAVADIVKLLIDPDQRLDRLTESRHTVLIPGEQPLVLDDATGKYQPGIFEIDEIEQYRRRDLHEAPTFIGSKFERLCDAQAQAADLQIVTDARIEPGEQPGFRPSLAGLRDSRSDSRRPGQFIGDSHLPTQRVTRCHTTHIGQGTRVPGQDDAAKIDDLRSL